MPRRKMPPPNNGVDYSALNRDSTKPQRNEKGHWLPGQSGNPGGAHLGYGAFKKLCQNYSEEALERVVSIMRGQCSIELVRDKDGGIDIELVKKIAPGAKVQLDAAMYVVDRAHGRPTVTVDEKKRRAALGPEDRAEMARLVKRRLAEYETEHGPIPEEH